MGLIKPADLIEKDIFELLGIGYISDEKKEELMGKIIEGVESRVVLRIDDSLEESDKTKFKAILDSGTDEEINQFLESKDISVGRFAAEEAMYLKSQIIQNAKAVKE